MDYEMAKAFIEKTLVNNSLRFWKNLDEASRNTIFNTDNEITNTITRAIEAFRLEFVGDGNILRCEDSTSS